MQKTETISQTIEKEQTSASRKLLIAAFIGVAFLYWMGLYLYMPTLPIYVQSKVSDLVTIGTILSMYGLWQLISRLPTGIAADFVGRRKPFIIAGLAVVGAGAWVLGSANGVFGLTVGRALTGVACATWVPLTVAFAALFQPKDAIRATGILTLVSTVARIIATSLTGFINTASGGYPLAFHLAAAVAWAGAVFMFFLPETTALSTERKPFNLQRLGAIFSRRDVFLPGLMNAVIQYGDWTATYSYIPILAKRLGANDVLQSALLSFNMAVVLLGNLIVASLVNRFGKRRLILASFISMGIGVGSAALATSLPVVFFSQAFVGLSLGIGYPVMMGSSIDQVAGEERSIAMGLHQSVYATGMFAGPWLSGIIATQLGMSPMFAITGAAILILGFTLTHLLHTSTK